MADSALTAPHLTSWLDIGVAAHRQGDLDAAIAAYEKALVAAPQNGAALNMLGTALLQLGRAAEAIPYLEGARQGKRNDPHLLGNLGQAYLAVHRYREAGESFRKASRLAPADAQLQVGIAAALALDGKLSDAETLLNRLTTRFPQFALVWLNLGNVFRDTGRFHQAAEAYRKALVIDANRVEARNALGSALHSLLRFAEAEREYRTCIASAPSYLPAQYNLASVKMDAGDFPEAEAVCRRMIGVAPDWPDAHRLLGATLALQSRLLEGIGCYRRAAELAPDDPQAAQSLGGALVEANHAGEGLRWLLRAATLTPDSAPLKRVTAGALLGNGCFQDGWRYYDARAGAAALRKQFGALDPTHSPGVLTGRHVCVIGEQGLGDELFFLRYARRLAESGAWVQCRVSPKLGALVQRAGGLEVLFGDEAPLARPELLYVLAGDLPHVVGNLPQSRLPGSGATARAASPLSEFLRRIAVFWPEPAPTLRIKPLPHRLDEVQRLLAAFGPPPYIGLTWRGGIPPGQQRGSESVLYKSIAPQVLGQALKGVGGTAVSLQRMPGPEEIEVCSRGLGRTVHDMSAFNEDLEGMHALLSHIDEYVGVSNTNMHLRAAAGRTARVLVPASAEWRWMHAGRSSPWFPGFPIYRQSLQGDWTCALAALARDLEQCCGSSHTA